MNLKQVIVYCEKHRHKKVFTTSCEKCSKEIYFVNSGRPTNFCSKVCCQTTGKFYKCVVCRKNTWITPKERKCYNKKCCSYKCRDKYYINKKHHLWKGGISKTKDGYVVLNESITRTGKKIKEHRYVMENYLKRKLKPFENIHHKNGIKFDNRIENLELWTTRKQPYGQRVTDLIKFVCKYYPKEVILQLKPPITV